jgi:hypothetical protein
VFIEFLVAAVGPVYADRRGTDEDRHTRSGRRLGEAPSRLDPRVADLLLVVRREPARDARTGEVDHRVDVGQGCGIGRLRIPLTLIVARRRTADEPHDAMSSRGQERNDCAADEPGRPGDGDREPRCRRRQAMRREVVDQLSMPVTEHGGQQRRRQPGGHAVGHRASARAGSELVLVVPPQGQQERP